MNKTLIGLINQSFQPTLPARGATRGRRGIPPRPRHFNPRSPHGERRAKQRAARKNQPISTHAPRTGSDGLALAGHGVGRISTHAPRTGSDNAHPYTLYQRRDFNPRSPHGERLLNTSHQPRQVYFNPRSPHGERPRRNTPPPALLPFQPTLPARGATGGSPMKTYTIDISTHAPRTGSDRRPQPKPPAL